MTKKQDVTAPYNFVPLSDQVYQPGDEIPSQDSPINDAESGVIAYTLTCDTPFLISGPDAVGGKHFITAPDTDRPIIPGSSLRGMIRNIMEIAAFGKMQFVQDQPLTKPRHKQKIQVHDLIRNSSADHLNDDLLDLPTRIFGRVANTLPNQSENPGFKTRVSFGWGTLDENCAYDATKHTTVMAAPQPSYAESYIDTKNAQIRGWKRYPMKRSSPPPPGKTTSNAASTLWPITGKNGLTFTGKIRYHNLTQIELGALVWALTWGGDESLRHSMGMGRKFGWGQVKITLDDDHKQAMKAFTAQMENQVKNWCNSRQIQQLRAMADPSVGKKSPPPPSNKGGGFSDKERQRQIDRVMAYQRKQNK